MTRKGDDMMPPSSTRRRAAFALATAGLLAACQPVLPLELYGDATSELPSLAEQQLTVETAYGGGRFAYHLSHQPNGFWRLDWIDTNDHGKAVRLTHGDKSFETLLSEGLVRSDRFRIYDIDPQTYGLAEIATAIGEDAAQLRSRITAAAAAAQTAKSDVNDAENAATGIEEAGSSKSQARDSAKVLPFLNAGPAPTTPKRFLLIEGAPSAQVWDADGNPVEPALSVGSAMAKTPEVPQGRMAMLLPRGVTIRAADAAFAGTASTEQDQPEGYATCTGLPGAPRWIILACLANHAQRTRPEGLRWQSDFTGLSAGTPKEVGAALRKLGRGLLANQMRKEEAEDSKKSSAVFDIQLIRVL
ncbi:hypothetical protein [uncultured Sphingomonas sp.]|uniref:hypothetical protein n=1 Tax=uncultured Sphingomonas sp. TaxID=158754 RepID=UPI00258CF0C3|nr:hypothetical protein [uncultured Sphingomonas sp.]